ncbi:MAG TPA: IS66 family transposase [Polyangiaceae bacterium]|nr:IS66 family transposase [Polyangiaceae bacterium]
MTGAARWREYLEHVVAERDATAAERDQYRTQYEQAAEEIARVPALEAEIETLRGQLREALKLIDLQSADIARYRAAVEASAPHQPERVPAQELKLILERVAADLPNTARANDGSSPAGSAEGVPAPAGAPEGASNSPGTEATTKETCAGDEAHAPANGTTAGPKTNEGRGRHAHGRRKLDLTSLPVVVVEIMPDEVRAAGGVGYERIGEEISDRLAFRPGSYVRLRIVRPTFVAVSPKVEVTTTEGPTSTEHLAKPTAKAPPAPRLGSLWCAPLPGCLWPYVMADTSAIAHIIVSKYDDFLPLNRQERISMREGFVLPRSTQCGWLGTAYELLYRIVDAMWEEARRTAFCIATDATGAPVRAKGACVNWHVFVMIADKDHIVFRPTREHTSATMETMFEGFHGRLLADAAPIYDVLYREHEVVEVGCWSHARRYFWRALGSDRERAMEALAIIAKLFEVAHACRDLPLPERTGERAARAGPVLALFDRWIERHREDVDERGPLAKAIGYYTNQREALRRFLTDGRLRLDNNISEQQVRNLVLGRANWTFFENRAGLSWYATFRSLIASCVLHGLNAEQYLEEVLRLAPHWPVTRMLELAPKDWTRTRAGLDEHQRAIVARPWESEAALAPTAPVVVQAA